MGELSYIYNLTREQHARGKHAHDLGISILNIRTAVQGCLHMTILVVFHKKHGWSCSAQLMRCMHRLHVSTASQQIVVLVNSDFMTDKRNLGGQFFPPKIHVCTWGAILHEYLE
jgi:hypothetical protein